MFTWTVSVKCQEGLSCAILDSAINQKQISIDSVFRYYMNHIEVYSGKDYNHCKQLLEKHLDTLKTETLVLYAYTMLYKKEEKHKDSVALQTLSILKKRPKVDSAFHADMYNSYGEYLYSIGRTKDAKRNFLEAIRLFDPDVIHEELARAHNDLSVVLSSEGNNSASLPHLRESLRQFTGIYGASNEYVAQVGSNYGITLVDVGRYEEAVTELEKSMKIYDRLRLNQSTNYANCAINLGTAYRKLNQTTKALSAHNIAYKVFKKLGNHKKMIRSLSHIASTKDQASLSFTEDEVDQAFIDGISEGILLKDSFYYWLHEMYNNMALRNYNRGQYKESILLYEKAFKCRYKKRIRTGQNVPHISDLKKLSKADLIMYRNLALSYIRMSEVKDNGQLELAKSLLLKTDTIMASLRKNIISGYSRKKIKTTIYNHCLTPKHVALKQYEKTNKLEYLNACFYYNELAINWGLTESFHVNNSKKESEVRGILSRIDKLKHSLDKTYNNNSISDSMSIALTLELEELKQVHRGYFDLLYSSEILDISDLTTYCKKNHENWLYYFEYLGNQIGLIFISSDTTIVIPRLADKKEVQLLSQKMNRHLLERNDSVYVDGKILYDLLVKPIDPFLEEHPIQVSRLSNTMQFPFEALVVTDTEGNESHERTFLIENNAISYQRSATHYFNTRKKYDINKIMLLAPKYIAEDLQYTGAEIENIHDKIGGDINHSHITSTHILEAIKNYDLVHFAGHTYSDIKNPNETYLLASNEEERLYMKDIIEHKSAANLLVLSSCHSASGIQDIEGLIGLNYAFSLAGSPNIISSKWEASDQESVDFFTDFYTNLKQGNNSIVSLQQAKINALKNGPLPARHPYFWANWEYSGHTVNYKKSNRWHFVLGGLFLAGLIVLGIIKYRNLKTSS